MTFRRSKSLSRQYLIVVLDDIPREIRPLEVAKSHVAVGKGTRSITAPGYHRNGRRNPGVRTMKVAICSTFDCSPDVVWERVQTSALLHEVIRPLLAIKPAAGTTMPERWQEGQSIACRMYLFGVLPLGSHTIRFDRIDPQNRQIQTKEASRLVRRWRHRIEVAPAEGGSALYSDEVEIDCGLLTSIVGWFAGILFRHRHRRWQQLIARSAPGRATEGVASSGECNSD
jgi:hypothetical protein